MDRVIYQCAILVLNRHDDFLYQVLAGRKTRRCDFCRNGQEGILGERLAQLDLLGVFVGVVKGRFQDVGLFDALISIPASPSEIGLFGPAAKAHRILDKVSTLAISSGSMLMNHGRQFSRRV